MFRSAKTNTAFVVDQAIFFALHARSSYYIKVSPSEGDRDVAAILDGRCCQQLQHCNPFVGDVGRSENVSVDELDEYTPPVATIDFGDDCHSLDFDGCTYLRSCYLGWGLSARQRGAGGFWFGVFCFRKLYNSRLRRCHSNSGLAAPWTDDGDERHSVVRMVNCCDFRSATQNNGSR